MCRCSVLSVVAPVWNEAPTLLLFYERTAVLDGLGEPWELILVGRYSTGRLPAIR